MFHKTKQRRSRSSAKYSLADVIQMFEPLSHQDRLYTLEEVEHYTNRKSETLKEYISAAKKYGIMDGYSKSYKILPAYHFIKLGDGIQTRQAIMAIEVFKDIYDHYAGKNFPDRKTIAEYISKKYIGMSKERAYIVALAFINNMEMLTNSKPRYSYTIQASATSRPINEEDNRLMSMHKKPNSSLVELRTESGILIATVEIFHRLSKNDRERLNTFLSLL